jgi:hypothetical protein
MNLTKHRAVIARLQSHGKWLVSGSSPTHIELSKQIGKHVCSVVLEREDNGYLLKPVTYTFRSVVSHFDYDQEENRWARNKNAFKALTKTLKRNEIWGLILNKDFLRINNSNQKTNGRQLKNKLSNELSEMLN